MTLLRHILTATTLITTAVAADSACLAQFMPPHEITADRRVRFEVNAPNARQVKLVPKTDPAAMGAADYEFEKQPDGKWTLTTEPCRPGFHYYELEIDGFRTPDPWSQKYFGWGWWASAVEVPDPDLDFYLPKDVPHGDVRLHWYHSRATGKIRKCLVYTPPGYDAETERRYPVLYLQHGAGESELGWTMQGRVNFILDNLIAEQKAVPMLIVMDNGYAARPGAANAHRPRGDDNVFAQLVLEDLVPNIDREFRTLADRDHRAIAGLSMGAGQAMRIGLGNLDTFGFIGSFSGGSRGFDVQTSYGGVFRDAAAANRRIRLLWIGCGELDRLYEGARKLHEALQSHGVRHVWHSGPGSHEWQVWRHHLHQFAQAVF